jgi:branched-chain amino acid transport system ATP-binding protein
VAVVPPDRVAALTVRDLHVTYGDFVAVQRGDFTVQEGECIAVVGPNGNGKSSIAMSLAGLVARRGEVTVFGKIAPSGNPAWMVKHGVSLVPERRQLFPRLSVADNVLLGCYAWTHSMKQARNSEAYEKAIGLFPELHSRLKQLAGTLSGGQQQMVALARGLAAKPKILITDEPCLGLAEIISRRLYAALSQLNAEGQTIMLIEENPMRALEICQRQVRVERGIAQEAELINPAASTISIAQ